MFKAFLFAVACCLLPVASQASVISDAAAACPVGNWCEVETIGMDDAWGNTGGLSGFALGWATEVHFDPVDEKIHFIGSDHNSKPRHIVYRFSNNTWTIEANPPAAAMDCDPCSGASHQYDHMFADFEDPESQGFIYWRHPYTGTTTYRHRARETLYEDWATGHIPDHAAMNNNCCHAIEWAPFLGGAVWFAASGTGSPSTRAVIKFWERGAESWVTVGDANGYELGTLILDTFVHCNSTLCIGGGGDDGGAPQGKGPSVKLYKIESVDGTPTVTALPDAPFNPGIQHGAVIVTDPVTERFLALRGGVQEFYEFNPAANGGDGEWTELTGTAVPPEEAWNNVNAPFSLHGVAGGSISTLGVVAFVSCQTGANPCRLFIYKHAAFAALVRQNKPCPANQNFVCKRNGFKILGGIL